MKHNRFNAINEYRAARWCWQHHLTPVAKLIRMWTYLIHNSFISYTTQIGEGTMFADKGIAVAVHKDAIIGKDCMIGTCVLIGGRESVSKKTMHEFDEKRRIVL